MKNKKIIVALCCLLIPTHFVWGQDVYQSRHSSASICEEALDFLKTLASTTSSIDRIDDLLQNLAQTLEEGGSDEDFREQLAEEMEELSGTVDPIASSIEEAQSLANNIRIAADQFWNGVEDSREYNECIVLTLNAYLDPSLSLAQKHILYNYLRNVGAIYQADAGETEDSLALDTLVRSSEHFDNLVPAAAALWGAIAIMNWRRTPIRMLPEFMRNWRIFPRAMHREFYIPGFVRSRAVQATALVGVPLALGLTEESWKRIDAMMDGPRINPITLSNYTLGIEAFNLGVHACHLREDLKVKALEGQENRALDEEDLASFEAEHSVLINTYEGVLHIRRGYARTQTLQFADEIELEIDKLPELNDHLITTTDARYEECEGSDINLNTTAMVLEESQELLVEVRNFLEPEPESEDDNESEEPL